MYNMSHWPFFFLAGFWQWRVLSEWHRREAIKRLSSYCARRVFRPVCIKNDIHSEMENQPSELLWPRWSHACEVHCWQWVSLLTGRHGDLVRHKDHPCVRVVLACSAPQAADSSCIKISLGWVKYSFSPSILLSQWTYWPASKSSNTSLLLEYTREMDWFNILLLEMEMYAVLWWRISFWKQDS